MNRVRHAGIFSHPGPTALWCAASSAFAPSVSQSRSTARFAVSDYASEVDQFGNNVKVKALFESVQDQRLLTKVAASGLLSKAQQAGISLSKLEPLLLAVDDNPDILVLVEASGPELLNILPTIVSIAPGALPLLASAVSVPAPVIGAAGLGALGAAAAAVVAIPDDSVANVAIQTFAIGATLPVAGASLAGAAILGKLTK